MKSLGSMITVAALAFTPPAQAAVGGPLSLIYRASGVHDDRVPWRGVAEQGTTVPGMAGQVRLPRLAG